MMTDTIPPEVLIQIDEFVNKLQSFNNGRPIPALWRKKILNAIGPKNRRGAPVKNKERDTAIAHRMLLNDLKLAEGDSNALGRNQYSEKIGREYNLDGSIVRNAAKKYRIEAMAMEVWAYIDLNDLDSAEPLDVDLDEQ